jgi:hypothetical protein
MSMIEIKRPRKKRSDRNHIIYELRVRKMLYIGVTYVDNGSPEKSLRRRWQKHVRRALTENKSWKLCEAIRKHGPEKFQISIVKVVRGKSTAHTLERQMIRELNPRLNSDVR